MDVAREPPSFEVRSPGRLLSVATRWAEEELASYDERGLKRFLEPLQSPQGAVVTVGGRALVNFSSNDYLGLANDARIAEAAAAALSRHGVGAGASRLLVGDSEAHQSLERRLCRFESSEAALLFNSGYAANVGVLSALCGPLDVIFSDELNHASIIDGCRLSRARVEVYPHRDVAALEKRLSSASARRKLVVTDAVFSMDGDLAPLEQLVDVCARRGAALVVDEAHATGVLGPRGAGLCEEKGLSSRVDVRIGTLSKALGVFGAYAATSRPVRELLVHRARSLVFSTALPPAICAAAERAIDVCETDESLRKRLWRNIHRFAEGLRRLGFAVEPRSAIFPVVLGAPEAAVAAASRLRERGLLVKAIRPPTVPEGTSRLRFALSAAHTDSHVDAALEALAELEVTRGQE